jgi:hypothetical protein
MIRRLFGTILLALALAGSLHVTVAAAPKVWLVCKVPNALDVNILIDSFDSVGGARRQCKEFWHGEPAGFIGG